MIVNAIAVTVGSLNLNKVDAVKNAYVTKMSLHNLIPTAVNAASEVSDQPIGLEETRQGALNRMRNALQGGTEKVHYTIGIENGLVKGEELSSVFKEEYSKQHWYDIAIVAMKLFKYGCQFTYVSHGVPLQIPNTENEGILPPDHHDTLETKLAKYSKVIMPLIRNRHDLYAFYTDGRRSRLQTIQEAIENAISKLNHVQVLEKGKICKAYTVITFGTFDCFHDLHKRLIRRSFSIGEQLAVYVYNKESKRKGKGRVFLQDTVQERISNVASYALEINPRAKVIVRRKVDNHLVELQKAIIEFRQQGTIAVFGGEDQMSYEKMLDLCFEMNAPVVTIPRGDDGPKLCSSDIREKLSYKQIANRYNLDLLKSSSKIWKSRIRTLDQAKEYLSNLRYFGSAVPVVWKYRSDLVIDQQLTRPYLGKRNIVVNLPGRKKCDLDRIRKILLTNVRMLNFPMVDLDYFLICYRDDDISTKFYIDKLERDPWEYFSDDAMIIVRDLLLPRVSQEVSVVKKEREWVVRKSDAYQKGSAEQLSSVTFFTRSRGSVIALEVENALLFCMKELGYDVQEIESAAKQIKVVTVCNLASFERRRLFSTVSFTGINDRKANQYITGFTDGFSKLYEEGSSSIIRKLSDTHHAVLAKLPREIKTYDPTGKLISIEDDNYHYTPLFTSERVGGDNTIPKLIIEVFRNMVLKNKNLYKDLLLK